MTCWEILGIEPTGDRDRIQQAYERQMKFASDAEARALDQAFREATGGASLASTPPMHPPGEPSQPADPGHDKRTARALTAHESQVAREVVIQIKALLNDPQRQQDAGIWKAILCEPPADQLSLRREVGRQLEPQVRPMAENGSFARPVAEFLGNWFDWFSVGEIAGEPDSRGYPDDPVPADLPAEDQTEQPPQMVNFWPAVIGWIIGLLILAILFGGMGG